MPRVLLGVSGGIAAYKTPDLVRRLRKAGHTVDVVLTEAAERLVSPGALATVAGRPVLRSMWEGLERGSIDHITVAAEAEAVVVAPATADLLARAAAGRASDLLSACLLVTRAPLLFAPAMNTRMWEHPFTRRNVETLARLPHVAWVGPEHGDLACGWDGPGRMAEPDRIVEALERLVRRDWAGLRVLVTAGPTREHLDPVRFLSNGSSGRMGQALAEAAARRGAAVTLVRGPAELPPPPAPTELVPVTTALEMQAELLRRWEDCDLLLMAAAVSDHRPAEPHPDKLRRSLTPDRLPLTPNPDILADLGRRRGKARRPVLVGFCVETERLAESARRKLREKRCDRIVANLAADALGRADSRVELHGPPPTLPVPLEGPKERIADALLDHLRPLLGPPAPRGTSPEPRRSRGRTSPRRRG